MFIHDIIKIEYIRQGYLPDYPYHLISDTEMFDAFLTDELKISQDNASKIKQGDSSLWDSPKKYINLYKLSSFELVTEMDGSQALIIRGNRDKLIEFNQLLGLDCDCIVSPDCYFAVNYPLLYDSLSDAYNELVNSLYYHINAHLNSKNTSVTFAVPNWVYSYMNGAVIGVNSPQLDIHDFLVLLNLDNLDDVFTEQICYSCLEISKKWIDKLPPSKNTMRPPTMYGEPHVIKSLRISGLLADDIV